MDFLIHRTLVYGALTAVILGFYLIGADEAFHLKADNNLPDEALQD